jgi:hypothetical protein
MRGENGKSNFVLDKRDRNAFFKVNIEGNVRNRLLTQIIKYGGLSP